MYSTSNKNDTILLSIIQTNDNQIESNIKLRTSSLIFKIQFPRKRKQQTKKYITKKLIIFSSFNCNQFYV